MKTNLRLLTTSIFFLLLTTTNSSAMPTFSDAILSPFRVVASPFVWWRHGYENKVDEYKVEITYNLELDGKPLAVTRAINCEIYEGRLRSNRDGEKRLTRRAQRTVNQITYKIEGTGEVLILPIPGYCDIDSLDVNRKDKEEKPNQKKSFVRLSDKWIPSFSIAKFSKENPDQIDRIERIISPKYYESLNARIKLKSFEVQNSSNLEVLNPEVENRFLWIDGRSKSDKKNPWGRYKEEDKGVYAAFGVFIYPKEIWSKIPKINDFITKAINENPNEEMLYISSNEDKWKGIGIEEVVKEAQYYLADLQSNYSINRYFGENGVRGKTEVSLLAKTVADGYGIMMRDKDAEFGKGWTPIKGKEKEFEEIYKKSNYRDYYHSFTFNEKENLWEECKDKKGFLVIQRINDAQLINIRKKAYDLDSYALNSKFKINHNSYNTEGSLIYDKNSKSLIIPHANSATYLQ